MDEIIKKLEKYQGLFLNYQSKFVLGQDCSPIDTHVSEVINRYDYISYGKNLHKMLSSINKNLVTRVESNKSKYHFDPKLFETEKMEEFLRDKNALDCRMYNKVVDVYGRKV